MKKIAIAIAIMLAFSAFAMAGDIVVTGDATTTFGYNLDTEAYGIESKNSSDVSITVGEADAESVGEGEWYGVIELTGASIAWGSGLGEEDGALSFWSQEWDADPAVDGLNGTDALVAAPFAVTAPDVAAKITNGNLYMMIQSEASFKADYVVGIEEDPSEDPADVSYSESADAGSYTFGGTFAPATIAVEIATAGDYEAATHAEGINLGATIGLDLAPLTVDAAFAGGFGWPTDQDMAVAFQVAADVAPATVTAAFDYLMPAVGDATMEVGAVVSADLDPLTVGLNVYYGNDTTDTEEDVDAALTVGYADDAMTADVSVDLYDVSTDLVWNTGLDVTFAVNSGVALAAGFSYGSDEIAAAYANVALTEVVDNVTFTIGWEEGDDLTAVGADGVDEIGQIIFETKIEY